MGTAEAETENAEQVLEEADMVRSAEAEESVGESVETDASAEIDAETLTSAELAVENVPPAGEEEEAGKTHE